MVFLSYRNLCNRLFETHGSFFKAMSTLQWPATRFSRREHPNPSGIRAANCIAAKKIVFRPFYLKALDAASPFNGTCFPLSPIRHLDCRECLPLSPVPAGAGVFENIDTKNEDVFETTGRRFLADGDAWTFQHGKKFPCESV